MLWHGWSWQVRSSDSQMQSWKAWENWMNIHSFFRRFCFKGIHCSFTAHSNQNVFPWNYSTWTQKDLNVIFWTQVFTRNTKGWVFLEKSCDFGRQSRLTNLWVLWVMSSRHAFGDLGQPQHDQWGCRTSMPDRGTEKRAYAIQEFSPHALPPGACERVFGESFLLRNEYCLIARFVFDYFVACFRFRGVILRWR